MATVRSPIGDIGTARRTSRSAPSSVAASSLAHSTACPPAECPARATTPPAPVSGSSAAARTASSTDRPAVSPWRYGWSIPSTPRPVRSGDTTTQPCGEQLGAVPGLEAATRRPAPGGDAAGSVHPRDDGAGRRPRLDRRGDRHRGHDRPVGGVERAVAHPPRRCAVGRGDRLGGQDLAPRPAPHGGGGVEAGRIAGRRRAAPTPPPRADGPPGEVAGVVGTITGAERRRARPTDVSVRSTR